MDIHAELLDRIRSAHRREMSMTAALAGEIVAATTHLSSLHAQEREARRRADAWPRDPRRDNMTPEERNSANLAEDDARRVLRHVERAAGRPAISEQTALRDHADAARRAGADVGVAVEQFARATGGVDPQIVQQAYEAATPARVKAERALQELEAERAQHGRRAGQLRQTLAEAERWMQANGIAAEALAA